MKDLSLLVTLWPSFPHFKRFAEDHRLAGIRLNSAMMNLEDIDKELEIAKSVTDSVPLYYDIKGRQLRVTAVGDSKERLECTINHPIEVETPVIVLFKAGEDRAMLEKVVDGKHLIFNGGPKFKVKPGESLHIRHPSLKVTGPIFTDVEKAKTELVRKHGFNRWFLSYVEAQRDVDEFRELIGKDAELVLKIESKGGLNYVENHFKKTIGTCLMAARGDLFVEVDRPHMMLPAMKMIVQKDPEAFAGSRFLLSMVKGSVPDLSDLGDLAWMYDIGYKSLMLCDEICLKEEMLARSVNVLDAFKQTYARDVDLAGGMFRRTTPSDSAGMFVRPSDAGE